MKRSEFTDEQILKIVREGEAGRKVADLCRTNGEPQARSWRAICESTRSRSPPTLQFLPYTQCRHSLNF
jgi:hypothetical protein